MHLLNVRVIELFRNYQPIYFKQDLRTHLHEMEKGAPVLQRSHNWHGPCHTMALEILLGVDCGKGGVTINSSLFRHPHDGMSIFARAPFELGRCDGYDSGSFLHAEPSSCQHTTMHTNSTLLRKRNKRFRSTWSNCVRFYMRLSRWSMMCGLLQYSSALCLVSMMQRICWWFSSTSRAFEAGAGQHRGVLNSTISGCCGWFLVFDYLWYTGRVAVMLLRTCIETTAFPIVLIGTKSRKRHNIIWLSSQL